MVPLSERVGADVDLKQIRYFVHVAQLRSFSKAARSLNVAQPALSRQIHLLEDSLRVQLLVRNSRGAEPTLAGLRLLARGQDLLAQMDAIREDVARAASHPTGSVTLGVPPSLTVSLAGPVVDACRLAFPDIRLRVIEGLSVFLEEWLALGRIDIAVLSATDESPERTRRDLAREELMLVGSAGVSDPGMDLPLERVAELKLTVTRGFRELIDREIAPTGLGLTYIGEFDSLHILREMLMRGGCVTILPESLIRWDDYARDFWIRRITTPRLTRRIICSMKSGRHVTPALLRIEELLAKTAAELLPGARLG